MTAQALEERGIRLKRYQPGEHRAPCPECDRGPRDDALAVRFESHGSATWMCHRCGFKGGIGSERERLSRRRDKPCRAERIPEQPEPYISTSLAPWGLDLWDSCNPILPGTTAAIYLDQRCCIVPPGDLRWHPALEDKVSGYSGPALVGLVTDALTGEPINLHRTWISADGAGKAPIEKPRRLLKGHRSRGVIRLWPDQEVTLGLVVGEGVETCLAAALESLTPVWATISAGNLAAFPVLPGIEALTILADHDKPNQKTGKRAGRAAALELTRRYTEAGFDPKRDIKVIYPPTEGEDVNDLVRKHRGVA
jgi:putative DNA primase/helicase